MIKITPLPLEAGINRCLAHGHLQGEWCDRRYQCACHETIKHDHGINAPAAYRKCTSDLMAAFIPLVLDEEEEAVDAGHGSCPHNKEVQQTTGDGTVVWYCPDCGKSRLDGSA